MNQKLGVVCVASDRRVKCVTSVPNHCSFANMYNKCCKTEIILLFCFIIFKWMKLNYFPLFYFTVLIHLNIVIWPIHEIKTTNAQQGCFVSLKIKNSKLYFSFSISHRTRTDSRSLALCIVIKYTISWLALLSRLQYCLPWNALYFPTVCYQLLNLLGLKLL